MTSCSLCVPHESVAAIDLEIKQGRDILLPYYREITDYIPSPVARSNYTPYHLFCLKKNITPFICNIDSAYEITFSTKENGNVMSVIMNIYKGGQKVILDSEVLHLILNHLDEYIDLYPYCLVYNSDLDDYDSDWINSIIPKLNCGIRRNKCIFVNLEGVEGFKSMWENTYDKIVRTIEDYYYRGVISLENRSNSYDFISKWNLKMLPNGLYEPVWNYCITPDKTGFLLKQIRGDHKWMIYVGEQTSIDTREGWLITSVDDYNQIAKIIEDILSN